MQLDPTYTGPVAAIWSYENHKAPKASVLTIGPGCYRDIFTASSEKGPLSDQLQYDENRDCYFHQSDDGNRDYMLMHVISLGDTPPADTPLDALEVTATMSPHIIALTQAMINQTLDPADMHYGVRLLSSPVWLHALTKSQGSIDAAQKAVITDILRYT